MEFVRQVKPPPAARLTARRARLPGQYAGMAYASQVKPPPAALQTAARRPRLKTNATQIPTAATRRSVGAASAWRWNAPPAPNVAHARGALTMSAGHAAPAPTDATAEGIMLRPKPKHHGPLF